MITYGQLDEFSALYVSCRMRAWDRKEIFSCRWTDSDQDLVNDVMRLKDFAWAFGCDHRPVAVVGAHPVRPGVWSVWAFATDEFPKVYRKVTKFVIRVMIPALVSSGVHRAECRSMEGHEGAQRWLEMLGARREGTEKGFGRNGEDYHVYVWTRPVNKDSGQPSGFGMACAV